MNEIPHIDKMNEINRTKIKTGNTFKLKKIFQAIKSQLLEIFSADSFRACTRRIISLFAQTVLLLCCNRHLKLFTLRVFTLVECIRCFLKLCKVGRDKTLSILHIVQQDLQRKWTKYKLFQQPIIDSLTIKRFFTSK